MGVSEGQNEGRPEGTHKTNTKATHNTQHTTHNTQRHQKTSHGRRREARYVARAQKSPPELFAMIFSIIRLCVIFRLLVFQCDSMVWHCCHDFPRAFLYREAHACTVSYTYANCISMSPTLRSCTGSGSTSCFLVLPLEGWAHIKGYLCVVLDMPCCSTFIVFHLQGFRETDTSVTRPYILCAVQTTFVRVLQDKQVAVVRLEGFSFFSCPSLTSCSENQL